MSQRWGWWAIAFVLGCSTSSAISGSGDAGVDASDGLDASIDGGRPEASVSVIGSPCIPSLEQSASFDGFNVDDVTVEKSNAACGDAVCLVDHFQGRTTCPYGQDQNGNGPTPDAGSCTLPGNASQKVSGYVNAQCADRPANKAVFCSCQCSDVYGQPSESSYCTCPAGYSCAQVVPDFGDPSGAAGGYCTKDTTAFDPSSACASTCDPTIQNCSVPEVSAIGGVDGGSTTYTLELLKTVPAGLCLPEPLPNGGSPNNCQIFAFLAVGDECLAHDGMSLVDPEVAVGVRRVAGRDPTIPVCQLAQLPQPCSGSASAGWCYLTGANAAPTCAQNIGFSATGQPDLDAGVSVALACP
jgi:hypothetical protein